MALSKAKELKSLSIDELKDKAENLKKELFQLRMDKKLAKLEAETKKAQETSEVLHKAEAFRDKVFTAQSELRKDIDALEQLLPSSEWPVPTYSEMLHKL